MMIGRGSNSQHYIFKSAATAIYDFLTPRFRRVLLVVNQAENIPSKFDVGGMIGWKIIAIQNIVAFKLEIS